MQQWTSATEELEALRRAGTLARCTVRHAGERDTEHGRRAVASVSCPDGWGAAKFLLALSIEDSQTAAARTIALELWSDAADEADYVARVFGYVRERVRFVREPGEVFARSDYTLAAGAGDCDDHARVVYALLSAGGVPARLAFLYKNRSDTGPRHVVAQALVGGRWLWLETTIAAELGEHPYEAAKRLGVVNVRSDIATEVRTMTEKDLAPIPAGFASRTSAEQLERDVAALKRLGFLCDAAAPTTASDPAFRMAVVAFQRAQDGLTIDGLIGPQTRGTLGTVPVVRQFTHAQAREALRRAYTDHFSREPSAGELDFGLATAYFETFYGRGTAAAWGDGGQFGRWAADGKINWGALQSSRPDGDPGLMAIYRSKGLTPILEQGKDAGRPVYFYLFPDDVQAARAFLITWGKADILAAAETNSALAVSAAMRKHRYYEGFHVAPGQMGAKKSPPFIQEATAEDAERKNIADYASALARNVNVVRGSGGVPDPNGTGGSTVVAAVVAVTLAVGTLAGAWWLAVRA